MRSVSRVLPTLVALLLVAGAYVPLAHADIFGNAGPSNAQLALQETNTSSHLSDSEDDSDFDSSDGSGFPSPDASGLEDYATTVIDFINDYLVPVIIAIAFFVFIWGVYKYFIQGAANEEDRKTGRTFIIYGIVGFVVIFALWGVVNLVGGALGLDEGGGPPEYPTL